MLNFRSPEDLVERWQAKRAAFLSDIALAGYGCALGAIDQTTDNRSSLVVWVAKAFGTEKARYRRDRRPIDWQVEAGEDTFDRLGSVAGAVIHIYGIPDKTIPNYGQAERGSIRPYHDIVFPNCSLEVESYEDNLPRQSLGNLDELTILTRRGGSYQVWPETT